MEYEKCKFRVQITEEGVHNEVSLRKIKKAEYLKNMMCPGNTAIRGFGRKSGICPVSTFKVVVRLS